MALIILLVEDEPVLRIVVAEFFLDCGFEVLEAEDADQALHLLRQHPEVSVMVTDVRMPGAMDGIALTRAALELRPDLNVAVTSAHHRLNTGELPPEVLFFSKPYDLRGLAAKLEGWAA